MLKDCGGGVAIEDLEGVRNRTRFRKKQRDRMSKWAFAELKGYDDAPSKGIGQPLSLHGNGDRGVSIGE